MTQGRSPIRINRLYEKISRLLQTDVHILLLSHDLKAWSESESRFHVRSWEKQFMSYFKPHDADASATEHIWNNMHLRVDREKIVLETPWRDSMMQGQEGFGSSMRHGHIIARFFRRLNAEFPDIVSSHAQSLTNIDDILFALFYRGGLAKNDAAKIFALLERTYIELGYTVDRTKSVLSSNKFIYLSRYFAQGIEILMPLKVVIRSALLYKNSLPDVISNLEAISGICRAIERQAGTALTMSSYYIVRCTEEVANLIGKDPETFPNVTAAGIVMAIPYCFGGLAVKDFASCARGGSKVSSLEICEVLDAGIALSQQVMYTMKSAKTRRRVARKHFSSRRKSECELSVKCVISVQCEVLSRVC